LGGHSQQLRPAGRGRAIFSAVSSARLHAASDGIRSRCGYSAPYRSQREPHTTGTAATWLTRFQRASGVDGPSQVMVQIGLGHVDGGNGAAEYE
jgi:hypothetical protein